MICIKANRNKIDRLLTEPHNEDEWLGSDTLHCESVIFEDGYMMDSEPYQHKEVAQQTGWRMFRQYGLPQLQLLQEDVGKIAAGSRAEGRNEHHLFPLLQ